MKRLFALLLISAFALTAAGCSQTSTQAVSVAPVAESSAAPAADSAPAETPMPEEQTEEDSNNAEETSTSSVLVVYFSRTGEQYNVGVIEKGNTAIVAEMIAEKAGADTYEILPADDHYPMTYKELTDVGLQEQRDGARPAIKGELPDFSAYETIFIGAPVWWGDWPMILYTFFESADLSGKTLIPFSTHAGSGLSGFDRSLQAAYPDSTVLKGLAIAGTDAQNKPERVEQSVETWLIELGY